MNAFVFKQLTIAALFLFSFTRNNAQSLPDPSNYKSIGDETRMLLFSDDFTDNRNNWELGIKENVWFENLNKGTLFFHSYENVPKEDYKDIIINPDKDFEIELSMRFERGANLASANGLQWGKSAKENKQYDFFFTASGQVSIDKFENGKFTDFLPFTPVKNLNLYTYNKLTVRKVGNNYYFFLNETLVYKMPFEPFFGNAVGFQVAEKSEVQIDYLKVYQLKSTQTETNPTVSIDGYKVTTSSGKLETGYPISLKVELSNTGNEQLNNIKLLPKFPSGILLLEKPEMLSIPAKGRTSADISFYINNQYSSKELKIQLEIDGAKTASESKQEIVLTLNAETSKTDTASNTGHYTLYRGGGDPLKGLNAAKVMKEVKIGKFFALIIGIDDYSGNWKPLKNAVNDGKAIEKILSDQYEFEAVKTLYNEQATRSNIISSFEWFLTNVGPNDNVLIYYSGHGEYRQDIQKGYWVPVDSKTESLGNYISNNEIRDFLGGIKSKHTLLITDACFSGDIFRGKTLTIPYENSTVYYNKVYTKPSRKAISSGGLEPVMDGGKEGHSIFAYYLLRSLSQNANKFYDASELFGDIKIPVVNNSTQTPEFNPIVNTGDEGGEFVFIRK